MKALRVFAVLILLAGGCLTGRALYLHAKAELAGILIRRAWEQSVQTGVPRKPWPWADTHPIARLQIPRLGYDEIVLEGATPRTLAFGPARLLSGASFGEPGNLVLAGHRTSWFRPLESIRPGDNIQVAWFDARRARLRERTYDVSIIRVVDPQDVTLLAPTDEDALTLVTCYPFGRSPRSPQRYVVRASPLEPDHDRPKSPENAKLEGSCLPLILSSFAPPRLSPPNGLRSGSCVRLDAIWRSTVPSARNIP